MGVIKNKKEKARFGIVGAINTALDFGLLILLKSFGLPTISANIISSTTAFVTSFILNKKVTFQTSGTNVKREVLLFVIVTLFGIWVIQNVIISIVEWLLRDSSLHGIAVLLGAKLLATATTLIWNYMMYSRVVFKTHERR
jgi:putative flippase GtrA